jgi:DNA polymerase III epsilon subunit-like protein
MKLLTFDVETTGLPEKFASIRQTWKWPYIVQISWMVYDTSKNKVISMEDHIVKLPKKITIPIESSNIHGITTEKMRNCGEDIEDILKKFMTDVRKSKILIAHNLQFDLKMISVEQIRNCYKKTLADSRKKLYCTMKHGKNITNLFYYSKYYDKMKLKPPKLIELHQKLFNETPDNLHNSLIDILVCFRCFGKLYWDVDILDKNQYLNGMFKKLCYA